MNLSDSRFKLKYYYKRVLINTVYSYLVFIFNINKPISNSKICSISSQYHISLKTIQSINPSSFLNQTLISFTYLKKKYYLMNRHNNKIYPFPNLNQSNQQLYNKILNFIKFISNILSIL